MVIARDAAEALLAGLTRCHRSTRRREASSLADMAGDIREAAAWCTQHADDDAPSTCLRPPELAPAVLPRDRWEALDDVRQSRQLNARGVEGAGALISEGRFLVYFPDCSLSDGAAEVESSGFLDVNNAPPFGTWCGYFEDPAADPSMRGILLAWIPRIMVSRTDAGIAVNPEECISWLDTIDVAIRPIVEFLRSAGWEV